jgi:hypothetical protein
MPILSPKAAERRSLIRLFDMIIKGDRSWTRPY